MTARVLTGYVGHLTSWTSMRMLQAAMGRVEARYAEASGADRQQRAEPERLSSKQVLPPTKPKHTIVIMRPS